MARIYFNCPCSTSNGNSAYKLWKLVVLILAISIVLVIFMPWRRVFNVTESNIVGHPHELHYGIVIDCGSSGSRVFVYVWPTHSGNPMDLLNIEQLLDTSGQAVVKKVSPGLSSFENNPDDASEHIKELLLYAQAYIPSHKHSETLLYVMATAGMRMLSESAQKAILLDLQRDIKKDFSFVAPENHFEVISGKQEGVYAWIAINYALNKFTHATVLSDLNPATVNVLHYENGDVPVAHTRKRTVGMIDMGGGSVQIAFEVTDQNHIKDIPSALLSEFNLGCQDSDIEHTYRVYVTTFLGYGANSARERYENLLIAASHNRPGSIPVPDVCLPKDMTVSSEDEAGKTHQFIGTGDYEACKAAIEPLLNLTVPCSQNPCSLNGIHQPHIDLSSQFYGFSEFWYSIEDVFRMGDRKYNFNEFHNTAKDFCSTKWSTLHKRYSQKFYPKADDHRFRFQCFKSAWVTQVFHKGFSFPVQYDKLIPAQLVNGKDVGWTLGALLFKTRFLPLRDIERLNEPQQTSNWRSSHTLDVSFLFLACFLVVLAAIVVYMKWLKCCPRKADLTRVPSMSYFMTEQDQVEQGIHTVKGQGYIL